MEDPAKVMRQFKPLLTYLSSQTGHTFQVLHNKDYAELLRRFRAGEIDLAYLGPLPYVELKTDYPEATPVVHFLESTGQASYTCALFSSSMLNTRLGSGKTRVALTQPLSTCGYLAADQLMRQLDVDLDRQRYRYLGMHDEVALSVVRGDFDLGVAKTAIARQYEHLGIRIVGETGRLPAFSLIANAAKMPAHDRTSVRDALVRLRPLRSPADADITRTWGENIRHGAVTAQDPDFEPVRRMRGKSRIPEQGNF